MRTMRLFPLRKDALTGGNFPNKSSRTSPSHSFITIPPSTRKELMSRQSCPSPPTNDLFVLITHKRKPHSRCLLSLVSRISPIMAPRASGSPYGRTQTSQRQAQDTNESSFKAFLAKLVSLSIRQNFQPNHATIDISGAQPQKNAAF